MISVIICTYNPEIRLIKRAIESVLSQNTLLDFELIIIDNCSSNEFLNHMEIKNLLNNKVRLLKESKQGLAYARIKGITNAKYDTIIFVDDDNELFDNYINNVALLFTKHPEVKIWGAGIIHVEFIDGAKNWIKKYMMDFFQSRKLSDTLIGNKEGWASFYPVGSGMVVEKKAFNIYLDVYNSGQLSATGRKGNSLASGEDSQIIWSVIKSGHWVGSTPLLELRHLIPEKRTTFTYLKHLNFNLSYSFYNSYYEVFGKNLNEKETIDFKSYILLFFGSLRAGKLNLIDVFKIYRIRKMWYDGYKLFLKQLK